MNVIVSSTASSVDVTEVLNTMCFMGERKNTNPKSNGRS